MAIQELQARLHEWDSSIESLGRHHIRDAIAFSRGLEQSLAAAELSDRTRALLQDAEVQFLLTLDVAVFVWIDDRFDTQDHRQPLNWEGFSHTSVAAYDSIEHAAYQRLCKDFERHAHSSDAFRLWLSTGKSFLSMQEREWLETRSHHDYVWTYSRDIDNAEVNSSIAHLMATLSLLLELDMHDRMLDYEWRTALRRLGVTARLMNDLASVNRERAENNPRNAVLQLEAYMSPHHAVEFVQKEAAYCESRLVATRADDELSTVASAVLNSIKSIYGDTTNSRYARR